MRSLHVKLAISYVALVAITLLVAMFTGGAILSTAQRNIGFTRAQNVILVLAQRIRSAAMPHQMTNDLLSFGTSLREPLFLVDEDGHILASTGQGAADLGTSLPSVAVIRLAPANAGRQNPIYTTAYQSPISKQRYYLAYAEVNVMMQGSTGNYLVVAVPAADVDPPWRKLSGVLFLLGGSILALAAAIGYWLARSITHPLQRMTVAADAIARGDYQQRLDIKGDDEVARLAESFNRMSSAVEKSNRAQRDLLTNVSHDLRTPLTSIEGFAQAILDGSVRTEDGYQRAGNIIHQETQRMQHLINSLIEIAEVESGILELSDQPIDWNQLVSVEVDQVRERLAINRLILDLSLTDLPGIKGDPFKLRQAIRNLLDNAIKYADADSKITVSTFRYHPTSVQPQVDQVAFGSTITAGSWVGLVITNSAEPVSRNDLEHFFERFYRGDKSRSQPDGSGLGLAIVREVVIAHHGRVEAACNGRLISLTILLPTADESATL